MSSENQYDLFEELEAGDPSELIDSVKQAIESGKGRAEDELLGQVLFEESDFQRAAGSGAEGGRADEPTIITEKLDNNCVLETIVAPGLDPARHKIHLETVRENPAKTYKFKLDPFQRAAVESIERNDSVLVAAHTSAGKTAVAEYVIAKCLKANQRVIYTSPIKALSNQKYRDLKSEFGSVGLVTGDVTLDENQTCLVMTTEILRNMLFRSNEIAKETAWVIFDEVHYMKDRERGVIWEETIILAPKSVRFCLLSATTPNASELAQWIRKIKGLDCINVVYTDYRPVPLEFHAFVAGEKQLLLLKNKKGQLVDKNIQRINGLVKGSEEEGQGAEGAAGEGRGKGRRGGPGTLIQDVKKIVDLLSAKAMTPGILFAFSKKDVELIAKEVSKERSLLEKREQVTLKAIFDGTISKLSAEDQKLPMIPALYEILRSGVGLHHGGMLPILKELVELLFQMNLIKVLVSTETFSMGVNMPAKAVVFTAVQKWDGEKQRVLSGSEFVQMAGRAGRRGLDDRGMVITMMDRNTDFKGFINSLKDESKNDPLISQFALSYNMVLNAMMTEGFGPEEMVWKSFKQFQTEQLTKKHKVLLEEWRAAVGHLRDVWFDVQPERFKALLALRGLQKKVKKLEARLAKVLTDPKVVLNYLVIGRLVLVKGCGWVPFVNLASKEGRVSLDVLVSMNYSKSKLSPMPMCSCPECVKKAGVSELKEPVVASVDLKSLAAVSSIVISLPDNLTTPQNKWFVTRLIHQITNDKRHELPLMELGVDIAIADERLKGEVLECKALRDRLKGEFATLKRQFCSDRLTVGQEFGPDSQPFRFAAPERVSRVLGQEIEKTDIIYVKGELKAVLEVKRSAAKRVKSEGHQGRLFEKELGAVRLFLKLGKKVKGTVSASIGGREMVFGSDLVAMKRVLHRLEFINKDELLSEKGRVASRVCGADELLLTQMMFQGLLSDLTARQTTVLLSFVVNEDRASAGGKKGPRPSDEKVIKAFEAARKTAKFVNQIVGENGLEAKSEEDLMEAMSPSMFEIVQRWFEGASFAEVWKLSGQYEGNVIRAIKRLHELLKEMVDCAEALGNKELKRRFEEGQAKLYRGIVFAASLYL